MMMMMAQMNTGGASMNNTMNPAAMNSVTPMTPMMNMMAPPPMSGMTQTPNAGFPSAGVGNAMTADQPVRKVGQ